MIDKYKEKLKSALFSIFLFCLVSCDKPINQEEKFIYEEIMLSMIDSWKLSAVFNVHKINVHDIKSSGSLDTFIKDDALFFLFPGETCNPCLEREFQKFLDWEGDFDKYILGFNANSNYLIELKRNHPEIRDVLFIQNIEIFKGLVTLPHIMFYRKKTGTYLNYAAVKSDINHFDYFKNFIETLNKE